MTHVVCVVFHGALRIKRRILISIHFFVKRKIWIAFISILACNTSMGYKRIRIRAIRTAVFAIRLICRPQRTVPVQIRNIPSCKHLVGDTGCSQFSPEIGQSIFVVPSKDIVRFPNLCTHGISRQCRRITNVKAFRNIFWSRPGNCIIRIFRERFPNIIKASININKAIAHHSQIIPPYRPCVLRRKTRVKVFRYRFSSPCPNVHILIHLNIRLDQLCQSASAVVKVFIFNPRFILLHIVVRADILHLLASITSIIVFCSISIDFQQIFNNRLRGRIWVFGGEINRLVCCCFVCCRRGLLAVHNHVFPREVHLVMRGNCFFKRRLHGRLSIILSTLFILVAN